MKNAIPPSRSTVAATAAAPGGAVVGLGVRREDGDRLVDRCGVGQVERVELEVDALQTDGVVPRCRRQEMSLLP